MAGQGSPELDERPRQHFWSPEDVDPLVDQLTDLRDEMLELEQNAGQRLKSVAAERLASARNLLHYVGLRREVV